MRDFLSKKQHIVVRGLLEESDHVLVVRNLNSVQLEYYELPGGYVEFGKDPAEALVDLFFTQTRILVDVDAPFRTMNRMSPNNDTQIVEIVYRVNPRERIDIKKPDCETILWIAPDDSSYFFSSHIIETIRSNINKRIKA